MEFVDTHAHIYLDHFKTDLQEVLQRSMSAYVNKIFMPNIDMNSLGSMLGVEDQYPDVCRSMIGLHPCSVKADFETVLAGLEEWFARRDFIGIGETGTDLYWDTTYREQQVESLRIQIGWAEKHGLPLVLHSRNSLDLSIKVIEENHFEGIKGVFHCFTGTHEQAVRIIEAGFYLGIGGVLTFKNTNLKMLLGRIPVDRIVLETDSPYLAPVPNRGKRNEPSYIPLIARELADIYGLDIEEIALQTTENAERIFRKS